VDFFLALTYNDEFTRTKVTKENKEKEVTKDNEEIYRNNDDEGARAVKKQVNENRNNNNNNPDKPARKK
jgi:hypothetical protein